MGEQGRARVLRGLRRVATGALASLCAAGACAFGFDDVAAEAAHRAALPHAVAPADQRLSSLDYDTYRSIRFRPEQALWRDSGAAFQVHFFPLGRDHVRPVVLHEIVDGQAQPLAVPATVFRNDAANGVEPLPGAAGFRFHFPLNRPEVNDELMVFLGASYFRVLASGLHYGISARGLAIDTTGSQQGEEFPAFTHFWLERPAPGARELRLYALLQSPRAVGAYAFTVRPGGTTAVDVQARVTLRAPVALLGVAPLTSMFTYGENQPRADDFRPEVHDSDGLQLHTAEGEWLWRPLLNPKGVFVTSFAGATPRGFGLMQRDRLFARYEDLEARYDQRPSAWVEPLGDWGPGRVELLQFHTPDETHDNIGAYWVPARVAPPGEPMEWRWRLHIGGAGLAEPPGARVTQSRRGHGFRLSPAAADHLQFHVDFEGAALNAGGLSDAPMEAVVSGDANVRAVRANPHPNLATGGWRVTLDVERHDARRPLELRLFLKRGGQTLTETWSYALPPEL